METRRDTLKIIGAIGSTCAFPFSSNDLYGQQEHHHAQPRGDLEPHGPYTPRFFSSEEYAAISRLADLIIPPTDTPGAVEARVPQYIDFVIAGNSEHQKLAREGLEWLARASGGRFTDLSEDRQIALLQPLSDSVDRGQAKTLGEQFFRLMKNLTADGYYTSQIGLVRELGYKGNTVLTSFPVCRHPEHA